MKANAFMWTALGATFGLDGLPWHALAAYLALCLTQRLLEAGSARNLQREFGLDPYLS